MESHATRAIPLTPEQQEREDRLGCRCQEVQGQPPGQGLEGSASTLPDPAPAGGTAAQPPAMAAEQLALAELHERLGSG